MSEPGRDQLLQMLVKRLERLSADSRWARRASGLRGSMLKVLDDPAQADAARKDALIRRGIEILGAAAHEIPDMKELLETFERLQKG